MLCFSLDNLKVKAMLLYHTTWLIAKLDPIKYLWEALALSGRLARWQVMLSKYDIVHVNQKAIKGKVIANFLASGATNDYQPLQSEFLDKDLMCISEVKYMVKCGSSWRMYFDGASNALGHGIKVILISPEGNHYPFKAKLNFDYTNNKAEHEACIMGLQVAIERGIQTLQVFRDSTLVI